LIAAQTNLNRAGSDVAIQEAAADKGYHANQTLVDCEQVGVRTYIPERESGKRRWTDKSPEMEPAFRNNRRRVRRNKGKRLQRKRSELVERSFAHVCETGGARRTWLRGKQKINKRYLIHVAARNLGLMMRDLFGIGKPRVLQGASSGLSSLSLADINAMRRIHRFVTHRLPINAATRLIPQRSPTIAVA
jgi:transposase